MVDPISGSLTPAIATVYVVGEPPPLLIVFNGHPINALLTFSPPKDPSNTIL